MPHDTPLISTIVAGLVLAFVFGALANRLRMPPLVGYLLAGVLVGPFTPGFVADQELALELSEIGIILLMFGVGLHFSLKDLISVQVVAVPGALGRIAAGMLMGIGVGWLMGWSIFAGMIFGLALSVASTVVLLKALQDRHLVETERGRIATGWVIVEDIAMVLALVLIPAFGTVMGGTSAGLADPFVSFLERMTGWHLGLWAVFGVTIVKMAAFVGFMLVVGRRLIPWLLHMIAHTGSRELFRLAVLAIALGVAAGSAYLFGVSLALGAFFAGMILSESELSHRAAEETLPLRDAFSVLFFVAVGMLFDPTIFLRSPLEVLATLAIVLVGKSVVAYFLMLLFRRSVSTALSISASLAQIGEFSFVLAGLGISLSLLPPEGRDLILAAAIVSIVVNPVLLWAAEHFRPALEARFKAQHPELTGAGARVEPAMAPAGGGPAPVHAEEEDARSPTSLEHHTVLIGYGRVGTVIAEGLRAEGRPFVLIEDSEERVREARAIGIETIDQNAATSQAMRLANVKAAETVIVAIPNAFEAGQATEQSRRLNPNARIIARAHSDEEEAHLRHLGADGVVMGEREIGMGMLNLVRAVPLQPEATQAAVQRALGKALDVGGRGPAGPEYVPPPPSTVTPGARAEIEAALNRALALEAGVAGAGMVAGAAIGPGGPAIAADEAQVSAEVEAEQAAVKAAAAEAEAVAPAEPAPTQAAGPEPAVAAVPPEAPVAAAGSPPADESEDAPWLHEPALEVAAAERLHADDLPEEEVIAASATAEEAPEAAEWVEDLEREDGGAPSVGQAEVSGPVGAAVADADIAVAADAAEELVSRPADDPWAEPVHAGAVGSPEAAQASEPEDGWMGEGNAMPAAEAQPEEEPAAPVEPYPDYWGIGPLPAHGPGAHPASAGPGAPERPVPPIPDTPPGSPDAPDLPPPIPDNPPDQPTPSPDPWWTPVPDVPTPQPPPIREPGDPQPEPQPEIPPPPAPERGPFPPPGPMEPPQPVASEAGEAAAAAAPESPAPGPAENGASPGADGDEPPHAPVRIPRPGQGNPAGN